MNFPCVFDFTPLGTQIPFTMGPNNDASKRGPHIDLRMTPELIDELPEVRQEPGWRNLLLAANDAFGHYRTIGCDFKVVSNERLSLYGEATQSNLRSCLAVSYLHIAHTESDGLDELYLFAGRLLEHMSENELDPKKMANIDLTFGFARLMVDRRFERFILRVDCRTGGDSEGSAVDLWRELSAIMSLFFLRNDRGESLARRMRLD